MADKDSVFEIGKTWGTDQVTALTRFDGYPVGVVASDSRHVNGGALTAHGCTKLIRFMDVCDVFHIPILCVPFVSSLLWGYDLSRACCGILFWSERAFF